MSPDPFVSFCFGVGRTRYFIRIDPVPQDDDPPRVPAELGERLVDVLSVLFDPVCREYWEAIDISSIPSQRTAEAAHREMHRLLSAILDDADPPVSASALLRKLIDVSEREHGALRRVLADQPSALVSQRTASTCRLSRFGDLA